MGFIMMNRMSTYIICGFVVYARIPPAKIAFRIKLALLLAFQFSIQELLIKRMIPNSYL